MRTLRFLNGPPDHTKITTVRRPRPVGGIVARGWYGYVDAGQWFWVRIMATNARLLNMTTRATHYLPPTTACLPWMV